MHATAVAYDHKGLLITGASGAGKSALALQLMALGAALIADDQVILSRDGPEIWARAPDAIAGLIEARGIGLLRAEAAPASIFAVIDLDVTEKDRFPLLRSIEILDVTLPLLPKVDSPAWPAALLQYLKGGRSAPHE